MKNTNITSLIKKIVVIMLLAGTSIFAWGRFTKKTTPSQVAAKRNALPVSPDMDYDPLLIEKFKKVSEKLDARGDEFFISGTLSGVNGADTTERISEVPYILSRKGKDFYYRNGSLETINSSGIYLYIDHVLKKIMISKEKDIHVNIGLPDVKSLIKNLRNEGYQVLNKQQGELECIDVYNEYHMSCKQYRLTFNSDLEPKQVYLRLSDATAPEDKTKDRTLEINIKKCGQYSDTSLRGLRGIVVKSGSSWIAGPEYQKYDLIEI